MTTHYYCLMDIPNHPLRVKGLQFLQSKEKAAAATMEVCTCPKCGNQLYCPANAVSLKCTCGYSFSVQSLCVCLRGVVVVSLCVIVLLLCIIVLLCVSLYCRYMYHCVIVMYIIVLSLYISLRYRLSH